MPLAFRYMSTNTPSSLENQEGPKYPNWKSCKGYVHPDMLAFADLSPSRWGPLPDPDASPPTHEPGLSKLCDSIRKTVEEEVKIVEHVFPNPGTVIQIFLQRVFAQSVRTSLVGRPMLN